MGTGYVRNDTGNNIADGNVINASDLDGEFDAVQAAFNASTGHSHDGTTGEGPQITTSGLADDAVTGAKIDSTTTVTAASFVGPLTGNASTASTLATARDISLTGDVSGSVSFNGSQNVSITATVADDSHNHVVGNIDNFTEEVQDIAGAMWTGNSESGVSVVYQDEDGTLDIDVNDPTITLSGDVSGSATMTNLGNVTITTTVADDSHNHTIANVDNLQTTLDAKVPLAGGTMTGNLNYGDNVKAQFGAGSDLQIYHDGSHSYIDDAGTGNLKLRGNNLDLLSAGNERYLTATLNGATALYYDDGSKLATTSTGIDVTGTVTADGLSLGDDQYAYFGDGNDFAIFHNGDNTYMNDLGTGNLYISTNGAEVSLRKVSGNEAMLIAKPDAEVELYYDDSLKLATTSDGVDITGEIYANRGRGATYVSGNTSGTFTPDFSEYTNFYIKLTGTTTFANPGDEAVGQSGVFVILQDATGGRTLSVGSQYKTVGGAGITLSSTASAVDVIPYVVYAADTIVLGQPLLAVS